MGWNSTMHPHKMKRKKEQEAQELCNAVNRQAARLLADARKQRDEVLAKSAATYNEAKEAVDLWHTAEYSTANENHNKKLNEFSDILHNLNQSKDLCLEEIDQGFQALKKQLILNKKDDEQSLEQCSQNVAGLAVKTKNYYGNNKVALDRLWTQVADEMLNKNCIQAYRQLKYPEALDLSRTKNYSLLVGYFKQLSQQNLISRSECEKYAGFCYALCNTTDGLQQNIDFNVIDREIINLLQRSQNNDNQTLSAAYKDDLKRHTDTYEAAINLDKTLQNKINKVKQKIDIQYEQFLLQLTKDCDQKKETAQQRHGEIIQQVAIEQNSYQSSYDAYINDLNNSKTNQLNEINIREEQDKEQINRQHQTYVNAVKKDVEKNLQEINQLLEVKLKQLKRSIRANVINAFTAVAAGAAAWFSGGLLSGVSSYIVQSVQTSLAATGLGAAKNLINGKDKFGISFQCNFSDHPKISNTTSNTTTNRATISQPSNEDISVRLIALRNQFRTFNQDVTSWQIKTEHHLFYSLNREISPSNLNSFNALMAFNGQSAGAQRSDEGLHVGARLFGFLQCAGGMAQVASSVAGGTASLATGIGPILAAGYATIGIDNIITGARAFMAGEHRPTILFQSARGVGLSDTVATCVEIGANLGPSVPVIAREGFNIAKGAMLKLYDMSRAKNLKWFEPKYVSTGGFRNELPLTPAQKQEVLDYAVSLGMPKKSIVFVDNGNTGYKLFFGKAERLQIGTDVLPAISKTATANSRVTMRGAIAHEVVGHRAAEFANMTQPNLVLEEAQASIRAARFANGLTNIERTTLLRDGIERLRKAGYKVADVKHDLWIHETLKIQLIPR